MAGNQTTINTSAKFICLTGLWGAVPAGIILALFFLFTRRKYAAHASQPHNQEGLIKILPFIEISHVYHMGNLLGDNVRFEPRDYDSLWHYEFGLFSVSLEPESWRNQVAGLDAEIFEISVADRDLRFLDADSILTSNREEIKAKGIELKLIEIKDDQIKPTERLYSALQLNYPSFTPLTKRSDEDQYLQASLAIMASQDDNIDGLWWTDTLSGSMRTERGGIFQHKLKKTRQIKVLVANNKSPKKMNYTSCILS